jgi:hypothetical protein
MLIENIIGAFGEVVQIKIMLLMALGVLSG